MKWRSILCIVLSLAAVCSLALVRDSAAWFDMETGEPLSQDISVKKLNFVLYGKLASYMHNDGSNGAMYGSDFIITDQNLITDNEGKITGDNESTMAVDARFCIIYDTPTANELYYHGGNNEDLICSIDSNWTLGSDNQYYYCEFDDDDTGAFDMINSIAYNGANVTRSGYLPETGGVMDPFTGTVLVKFQAKQHDHVDWEDIWTIGTP